eukprot:9049112-Heterocapsa_arctica.AAC.1
MVTGRPAPVLVSEELVLLRLDIAATSVRPAQLPYQCTAACFSYDPLMGVHVRMVSFLVAL